MSTANPNQDICEMLTKLGEYERDVNGIQHKYFAYRKACKALESIDTRVKSGAEAQKLPFVVPIEERPRKVNISNYYLFILN